MSTSNSQLRHETIRRMLAQPAAGEDAGAIAEAAISAWHQMAHRLAPVIGGRGVEVLFSRALHLTSQAFPWLGTVEGHGEVAAPPPARVSACLASHEPAAAAAASLALLVTFTDLLATLIGDSLTDRLLDPVWLSAASPPSDAEQENAS